MYKIMHIAVIIFAVSKKTKHIKDDVFSQIKCIFVNTKKTKK